jgi:hypothetical protein
MFRRWMSLGKMYKQVAHPTYYVGYNPGFFCKTSRVNPL